MFFDPIVKYFPDRSPYFPATALYFCPILCASVLLSLASVPQFRVTLETHVEIVSSCAIRLVHFFLEGVPSISCSCISWEEVKRREVLQMFTFLNSGHFWDIFHQVSRYSDASSLPFHVCSTTSHVNGANLEQIVHLVVLQTRQFAEAFWRSED